MAKSSRAPWDRSNPRKRAGKASKHLSSKKKSAKRPAAKKKAAKKKSAKKSAKKTSSRKRSAGVGDKDPQGGLTAAGRKAFARKSGSHLKPGVTKKETEMTPQDMRRKGSWAVRFYGRKKLPPLVDGKGRPTRHALSAHAWGEPVPRTEPAARRIAAKGKRLLERYDRLKRA